MYIWRSLTLFVKSRTGVLSDLFARCCIGIMRGIEQPGRPPVMKNKSSITLSLAAAMSLAAGFSLGLSGTVAAGGLSRSLGRALASKFGSSVKPALRSYGARLEQRAVAGGLTAAEEAALRRVLADLDRKTLSRIEAQFERYIPAGNLTTVRNKPTEFLDHRAFQQRLRQLGNGTKDNPEAITGVTCLRNRSAQVDHNQVLVPRVVAHEKIHQLAHPRYRNSVGEAMDEGTTEYLAGKIHGEPGIKDMAVGYPEERDIIGRMAARVGDERLAQAYFQGRPELLREPLDAQLGPGAFDDFVGAMRGRRYEAARRILSADAP